MRSFFASLDPADAARLAVLYPAVVGNLDGVPLATRVEANRINVAAALYDERQKNAKLVEAVDGLGPAPSQATVEELSASTKRLRLYQSLLYERVNNPSSLPGRERATGHQVVAFDPQGDGKIAELWGDIDDLTLHVGIFVPGTGSDMANFGGNSERARRLVQADPKKSTAVIAWLGTDMPDEILFEATDPRYSQAGAPRLRNFYTGLDIPSSADTTVIGHSYGGATVGLAEAEGMHPTRILMVESAGTGYGLSELSAADTATDHYSMTAPGDAIKISQYASPLSGSSISGTVRILIGHPASHDWKQDGSTTIAAGQVRSSKASRHTVMSSTTGRRHSRIWRKSCKGVM